MKKFKIFFLLIFTSFPNISLAECLREHLHEAQILNQYRKPLYSKLTKGESEKISNLMIQHEKFARYATVVLLPFAKYFRSRGIPILCEEFISMKLAPKFQIITSEQPISEEYKSPDTKALEERLKKSLSQSFTKLGEQTEKELKVFKDSSFNCMTKHILESIARSAYLSKKYVVAAKKKDLFFSPSSFLHFALKTQIESINQIKDVDIWSAPIQKKGIAIICNDVPHVPAQSAWTE